MWHASVAGSSRPLTQRQALRFARGALAGVGDLAHEWVEVTDVAAHVRRRLTAAEDLLVGPVVDVRGTPEAQARYAACVPGLGGRGMALAQLELDSRTS